jgi:hypothetical protein
MSPSREEIEEDIVIVIEDESFRKQEAAQRKRVVTGASKWDFLFYFMGGVLLSAFWIGVALAALFILSVMETI